MNNKQEYNRVFMEIFSLKEEEINEEIAMGKTSGWDSVGHVELITTMEDVFDITFETEDILNFISYDKGIEILKKHGIEL